MSAANESSIRLNTRREILCLQATINYFVYIYSMYRLYLQYIDKLISTFLIIFRRFSTTLGRFSTILQELSEGQMNVSKHFPKKYFRSISEDFGGRYKDVSIIHKFKYNLRVKHRTSEVINIFTSGNM